ncbi:hypothetical protein UlMin_009848 [Ulmus minor]
MDMFFAQELESDISCYFEPLPVINSSSFQPYTNIPRNGLEQEKPSNSSNLMNMNKRMIDFLRRSMPVRTGNGDEHEKERCYRHMMNERMRRDKQKRSYSALHSMLPMGTKNDKNSIVQIATMKIQQLEKCIEELKKRNIELEAILELGNGEDEKINWSKIKLKVVKPTSGVDSMVEVLNCLKKFGFKTRSIRSFFSSEEFSAEVEIESKVGAAEIEEAMQQAIYEAEWKLRVSF